MKKVALPTLILVLTSMVANAQVFFSQYYEGASYDKFIELYNAGTTDVNLASPQLYLCIWSNVTTAVDSTMSPTTSIPLTGVIPAGSTYLLAHSSAVNPTYGVAAVNQWFGNNFSWDANSDVFALTAGTGAGAAGAYNQRIDIGGRAGLQGANRTGIRRPAILAPNTTFTPREWRVATYLYASADSVGVNSAWRLGVHKVNTAFTDNNIASKNSGTINNTISFFPNPANNSLFLSQVADRVEIMDITGRIVRTFTNGETTLNISSLSAGQYLLRTTNEGNTEIQKFSIVK